MEYIHVLRRILEGCKGKIIPITASFLDFKKAFYLILSTTEDIIRNYWRVGTVSKGH